MRSSCRKRHILQRSFYTIFICWDVSLALSTAWRASARCTCSALSVLNMQRKVRQCSSLQSDGLQL